MSSNKKIIYIITIFIIVALVKLNADFFFTSLKYPSNSLKNTDGVLISVFYETLCPDSSQFINTQLSFAFKKFQKYVNFKLVPFGKADVFKKFDFIFLFLIN